MKIHGTVVSELLENLPSRAGVADLKAGLGMQSQASAANLRPATADHFSFDQLSWDLGEDAAQLFLPDPFSVLRNDHVPMQQDEFGPPDSGSQDSSGIFVGRPDGIRDAGIFASNTDFFNHWNVPIEVEAIRSMATFLQQGPFGAGAADQIQMSFAAHANFFGWLKDWTEDFVGSDLAEVLSSFGNVRWPDVKPGKPGPDTLPQGVAAGDVTDDSIVLWARSLAPGKIAFSVYEVKENGRLKKVAKEKVKVTDTDVSAKVLIDGLEAGTDYVYKVRDAAGTKKIGRFSTAADEGHNGLTFGVSGDWRGDLAPYPAISNADDADLDFFLFGGDTTYADFNTPAYPQTLELEGFRIKYQEVYGTRSGENFFADLRASTAVYATIDDHELGDNFAGAAPASVYIPTLTGLVNDSPPFEEALQAFQEYHPIADVFYGETGDDRTAGERALYRSQTFGEDAALIVLDGRSFRDLQIESATAGTPAEIAQFQIASFDPTRTMLGAQQLADLKTDLLAAKAGGQTWKFVFTPVPIQDLGINSGDSWEGYKAERTDILSFIDENDISNVVFIAGDLHGTAVNNLTYSTTPLGEQIAMSAFEITTGSVAFDGPFGPSVIEAVSGTPLLPPEQEAFYNALPIAPDGDGLLNDKDDFIREFFKQVTLDPLGLDPLGLDDNLPQADGLIDAELLQGGWVSTHTYGWTEFDIDAETQALTVTTWGIDYYTEDQLLADPSSVVGLEPRVVSQFVVYPELAGNAAVQAQAETQAEFDIDNPFLSADTPLEIL